MNNKIAVMQPYLFPYIGYFQLLNAADKFVILDDVNYINKGWINRNYILVNNEPSLFTIPLSKASQNKFIKDIETADDNKWKAKFLKTIERSYGKAPFFNNTYDLLSGILLVSETGLSNLIFSSLLEIKKHLDIKTEIIKSSQIYLNNYLKGGERIADICLKENSSFYINPSGGTEIYSRETFENKGVSLNFIRSKNIEYKQVSDVFYPSLSIIDVFMFNSKERIREYLNDYELF